MLTWVVPSSSLQSLLPTRLSWFPVHKNLYSPRICWLTLPSSSYSSRLSSACRLANNLIKSTWNSIGLGPRRTVFPTAALSAILLPDPGALPGRRCAGLQSFTGSADDLDLHASCFDSPTLCLLELLELVAAPLPSIFEEVAFRGVVSSMF